MPFLNGMNRKFCRNSMAEFLWYCARCSSFLVGNETFYIILQRCSKPIFFLQQMMNTLNFSELCSHDNRLKFFEFALSYCLRLEGCQIRV